MQMSTTNLYKIKLPVHMLTAITLTEGYVNWKEAGLSKACHYILKLVFVSMLLCLAKNYLTVLTVVPTLPIIH